MGDPKGFLKIKRQTAGYRPVCERVQDYAPVSRQRTPKQSQQQASRCMDCGTPFCHWGCPVGNYIPEWNDLMFQGQWAEAYTLLEATNNFPEFTGRVCPATCEYACVLGINDDPVTIRENELALVEYAFKHGLVESCSAKNKTGKRVAVIGSGPAGLACADQLTKVGHHVSLYEKNDRIGGILRYGIPDFKLEKQIIDRRLELLRKQGVEFIPSVNVGVDYKTKKLLREYDAVCLTGGSSVPRDLKIPGRKLKGIHFAMDYLTQGNKRVAGIAVPANELINAAGKKVVVIGGGDTGSDCVGTANRQGAGCVVQIEVLNQPPECRDDTIVAPWPQYPLLLKTSSSHEEGAERQWAVLTKEFIGEQGRALLAKLVKKIKCVRVEFRQTAANTCPVMQEVRGSEFTLAADLVILAVGFLHPEPNGLLSNLGVTLDRRGNVQAAETFKTSLKKVFTAGDMHTGQSLVVKAIAEGRKAAYHIDRFLMGSSVLPYI